MLQLSLLFQQVFSPVFSFALSFSSYFSFSKIFQHFVSGGFDLIFDGYNSTATKRAVWLGLTMFEFFVLALGLRIVSLLTSPSSGYMELYVAFSICNEYDNGCRNVRF